jgi:hypothetical protein
MKKGGGKAKGSGFERDISRFFTRWLTGQDKELYFWRSPSSGQVATVNLGNKSISGDIIALKPQASWFIDMFAIECKTGYPSADFHQLLKYTKNFDIEDFWLQVNTSASEAEKQPMLIFKKNNHNAIVGISCSTKYVLKDHLKNLRSIVLYFDSGLQAVTFYDMERFFEAITPEVLKKNG